MPISLRAASEKRRPQVDWVESSGMLRLCVSLNTISQDYPRAEITCAWVHERPTDGGQSRHVLVFAVAELCPEEQPPSPSVGSATHGQLQAKVRPNVRTLYVRRDSVTPAEAIAFFRGIEEKYTVPGGVPPIESAGSLDALTADEESVLIASNLGERAGTGAVLPQRPTALAVLSKLDVTGATSRWLGPDLLFVVDAIRRALAVDLSRFAEHLGSLHLCFCDPLLRRMERSLTADERSLLVRCYERENRSVVGCEIELTNEWPGVGSGFYLRHTIRAPFFVLPVPAQPHLLRVRVFDRSGRCIEDDSGVFVREVITDVGLVSQRRVTYASPHGETETHEIQTVAYDASRAQRGRPLSPLQHLHDARRLRELNDLAVERVFVFFPGGSDSRREALGIVRELVGTARDRCVIVDPYLSARDAQMLVPFVRHANCAVRILSSRMFLHDRGADGITRANQLATAIDDLRTRFRLSIAARQIRGRRRSPVHDRLLVIDETVYLLGSSLSEYGDRATTLFRVPDGRSLLAEIEIWWTNALTLDDSGDDDTEPQEAPTDERRE
jgi:hypothetical protein